jgi:hypothetical protein
VVSLVVLLVAVVYLDYLRRLHLKQQYLTLLLLDLLSNSKWTGSYINLRLS